MFLRSAIAALAVWCSASASPVCAQTPPDAVEAAALADAGRLKAEGDFAGAAAAWATVARARQPHDPVGASQAWIEAARSRLGAGDGPGAAWSLDQAILAVETAFGPETAELVPPLLVQAKLAYIEGRYEAALAWVDRGLPLVRADTPLTRADLLFEQGKNLDALGRFDLAEVAARETVALRTAALGAEDPYTADALNQLANALTAQGLYAEAEPVFRRALAAYEAAYGADSELVALTLSNLGNLLRRVGRHASAETAYRTAVEIAERMEDPVLLAQCLTNLGWHLHVVGRGAEAEPVFRRALDMAEHALGPDHPFIGLARANLAVSLTDQSRHAEAEVIYLLALPVLEAGLGTDSPDLLSTLEGYALTLAGLGRAAETEALHVRSATIVASRLAPGHPEAVRLAALQASWLLDSRRPGDALAVIRPVRADLMVRAGQRLEGGDPLRRGAPLFAQQVRAAWMLSREAVPESRDMQ